MSAPNPTHPVLSAIQGIPIIGLPSLVNNTLQYDQPNNVFIWVPVTAPTPPNTFAVVVKSVIETKQSDSVSTLDNELFATLPVGIYNVLFSIYLKSHATADLRFQGLVSTGTMTGVITNSDVSAKVPSATFALGTDSSASTSDSIQVLFIPMQVTVTVEGIFGFGWGQLSSQAEDTSILAGSSMIVYQS